MKTWRWTLLFVTSGALAFACTVEDKDNDDSGTTENVSSASTGGSSVSSTSTGMTTTSTTTAPMGCYNEQFALDCPGDQTLTGLNHCTPMQVTDFSTACLGTMASQQACDAYHTANMACWDCILPVMGGMGNSDMSTPVLLPFDDGMGGTVAVTSQFACEAVAQNLPQCGPLVQDFVFCIQTACKTCMDAEFSACSMQAEAGICAQAAMAVTAECEPILQTMTFSPQCDGADFVELYTNIANFFCGP